MRTLFQWLVLLGITLWIGSSVLAADDKNPNVLTEEEKNQGFELLFNGRTLDGWEAKDNWVIEEGAIHRAKKGGDITYKTKKVPDDFELRFQWKVGKGSNSGVYYRPGQYEYQILDNKVHPDGKNPRTSAASLYFCMAPSKDATKPVGEWNDGRIICKGSVIQHWLNGEKVVDFDYLDRLNMPNFTLLKARGAELNARGAYLRMQDHGDPVWYRGVKMRALPENAELDRTPVKPQPIPPEMLEKENEILKRFTPKAEKEKK